MKKYNFFFSGVKGYFRRTDGQTDGHHDGYIVSSIFKDHKISDRSVAD